MFMIGPWLMACAWWAMGAVICGRYRCVRCAVESAKRSFVVVIAGGNEVRELEVVGANRIEVMEAFRAALGLVSRRAQRGGYRISVASCLERGREREVERSFGVGAGAGPVPGLPGFHGRPH